MYHVLFRGVGLGQRVYRRYGIAYEFFGRDLVDDGIYKLAFQTVGKVVYILEMQIKRSLVDHRLVGKLGYAYFFQRFFRPHFQKSVENALYRLFYPQIHIKPHIIDNLVKSVV